jgi:putative PIN family toxin of toxin-antitoxin system
MRFLYDSNVLVTILSRREAVLEFKKLLVEQGKTHVTSAHVLSEVEAVLAERFGLTKRKAKASVRLLSRASLVVTPRTIERVCRDPFDDYVLAAALEGNADYLVTADKDLLVLKQHKEVRIITPDQFSSIFAARMH